MSGIHWERRLLAGKRSRSTRSLKPNDSPGKVCRLEASAPSGSDGAGWKSALPVDDERYNS
jgi:hypothetical protein